MTTTIKNRLRNFFSTRPHKPEEVLILEKSLEDTRTMYHQQSQLYYKLKNELQAFHSILDLRSNCLWKRQYDQSKRLYIITTRRTELRVEIIIYIPREGKEIAAVYAQPIKNRLVAYDMKVDINHCDPVVGQFILRELAYQAIELDINAIDGHLKRPDDKMTKKMIDFYEQAGFTVEVDTESVTLQFKLNNNAA